MAEIAFLGFGELGTSLADGLTASPAHVLRAYTTGGLEPRPSVAERMAARGVRPCDSVAAAVADAAAVLSVVPSASARELARAAAPHMRRGALYVDLSSSSPEDKRHAAAELSAAGAAYVDAAVLGTVAVSGSEVPILAAGDGAERFADLARAAGLHVTAIGAPAGHAALVKLLRGIYLKGRDALIVEMLLAARRYGVEELVVASIGGPGEQVDFGALAERVLRGVAVHAGRRADELAAASEVARQAGVDPALTRAGAQTLRRIAALGLRERFGAERPDDAESVLAAIEELERATGELLTP